MAQKATLNIRLDETLKQHGSEVLQQEGISVSEAVRRLYVYLEKHRALPPELADDQNEALGAHTLQDRRRVLLRSMVGILPSDDTSADIVLSQAREARFSAHEI